MTTVEPDDGRGRMSTERRATGPRVLWTTPPAPEPGPDVAEDLPRYREWVAARLTERLATKRAQAEGETSPEIALLVPLSNDADAGWLTRCLASLRNQTVNHWRLAVVVLGTGAPSVERALQRALASLPADQGGVYRFPAGTAVPDALTAVLRSVASPALTVIDPSDQLAPDAVARLSAGLVGADVVYADEDRVDAEGLATDPLLKPDWSPELCLEWNYLGRPVAYRRSSVRAAGGIRSLPGGDWEHDLVLRTTERAEAVAHIAEVLCHRRAGTDPASSLGAAAVAAALERRGERNATVTPGPMPTTWRIERALHGQHLVSAVIPFRDSTRYLRTCVDSILATSADTELELILVDNGSVEPETQTLLERLTGYGPHVRVVRDDRQFNWAALNNGAVRVARGDVLLFLNDDVEARSSGWLEALAVDALRPEIGAAGGRLLYPSGQVQFAGMVVGLGGAAGHVLAGLPAERPGYLGMAVLARDVSAVTGACMATRREVFEALGGFDEGLGVDCNDVDYCLRARANGLRIIYQPAAELLHHESPSRGTSGSNPDIVRFVDRWEKLLPGGDPFLNANLTRADGSARLALPHEVVQWRRWRAELAQP